MLRIDYHDQPEDLIEKINRALVPHGLRFVDDGQPHDGFCLFAVESMVRPLAWFSSLPTSFGWYWFRDGAESTRISCVQVAPRSLSDSTLVACGGSFGSVWLAEITWGQWAGPIQPPA